MKSLWRVLARTVFWSFERGTWPYDAAVLLIVCFVLLSPRSWFRDRSPVGPPPNPAMVERRASDPAGGVQRYRVDARLLGSTVHAPESQLEHDLHEAIKNNLQDHGGSFQILRIEPIRGDDGSVSAYDVSIK